MYRVWVWVWMCTHVHTHAHNDRWRPEEGIGSHGAEGQVVESYPVWVLGTKFCKTSMCS